MYVMCLNFSLQWSAPLPTHTHTHPHPHPYPHTHLLTSNLLCMLLPGYLKHGYLLYDFPVQIYQWYFINYWIKSKFLSLSFKALWDLAPNLPLWSYQLLLPFMNHMPHTASSIYLLSFCYLDTFAHAVYSLCLKHFLYKPDEILFFFQDPVWLKIWKIIWVLSFCLNI